MAAGITRELSTVRSSRRGSPQVWRDPLRPGRGTDGLARGGRASVEALGSPARNRPCRRAGGSAWPPDDRHDPCDRTVARRRDGGAPTGRRGGLGFRRGNDSPRRGGTAQGTSCRKLDGRDLGYPGARDRSARARWASDPRAADHGGRRRARQAGSPALPRRRGGARCRSCGLPRERTHRPASRPARQPG